MHRKFGFSHSSLEHCGMVLAYKLTDSISLGGQGGRILQNVFAFTLLISCETMCLWDTC